MKRAPVIYGNACNGVFKKILPVFLTLLFWENVFAQNPPFISYNEQNGLSTSVVYGLFQDSQDNIWFCTNAGVVKFNGTKLITYEKKDGLTSNDVFKIFEDSKQRLWFMTASGKPSYYYKKKIYNETDHPVFSNIRPATFISDIREDANKNIWIIPDIGNLYIISGDLKSVRQVPANLRNGNFFLYQGHPFIAFKGGIYDVDAGGLLLSSPSQIMSYQPSRHCQWGENIYSGRDGMLTVYNLHEKKSILNNPAGFPAVLNSMVMIDSSLYVCSNKGLSIYDRQSLNQTGQFFSSENVSHVLKDREGSLWISSLNDGVKYIPNNRISFLKSSDFFDGNKILKLNGLGNHVIIGQSNSKAIYYYKGKMRSISSPGASRGEGLTYAIRANAADSDFIISNQAGVTQFSLKGGLQFTRDITILGYAVCGTDSAYISSPSRLAKYSRKFQIPEFSQLNYRRVIDSVRADALYYDPSDSVLYACSKKGFFQYKAERRIPNRYPVLNTLSFTDIDKSKAGIFIATTLGDGVFFFNQQQILNINEKTGLTNNMCSSLFVQNDSTIWVATYNGLNRIICRDQNGEIKVRVMNFYRNDGLPSNYINDIYIYRDSIWLATNIGLAVFSENDLTRYSYTPMIAIEAFKVNGNYQAIPQNLLPDLERNNNNIVIEFNCSSFRNAGSVGYKYKLSGLNSNWQDTRNNQVDFTGLAPGHYQFEVYAYSINGNWKTGVATISFSIRPAFWERTWFRILAILLFLVLVVWIIIYQFRKVKREFAIRQKLMHYEKELLEMEQQALRLQMNPHFIFNALNSIQHAILTGKQEMAYHHLELFSSLIRGILENSKHKFITLEDEIGILNIYMQIEAARFDGNFKYEMIVDPNIDIACTMIPPMLIQPFVENSIWHGLMPKSSGEKKLVLSFTAMPDAIVCKVEDNGVGRRIAAENARKKQGTSMGTQLTMNRLANINLLEKKKYSIDIYDKENDGGTIVTITIQV